MSNTTDLKGNWNEKKRLLKQKFAMLTETDLTLIEGQQNDLISRLQIKLGRTREDIYRILSDL